MDRVQRNTRRKLQRFREGKMGGVRGYKGGRETETWDRQTDSSGNKEKGPHRGAYAKPKAETQSRGLVEMWVQRTVSLRGEAEMESETRRRAGEADAQTDRTTGQTPVLTAEREERREGGKNPADV